MNFGLEREYFVGKANWNRESDQVFSKSWNCVGRVEALFSEDDSACFRAVQIGDFDILLIRSETGLIQAFHNVCRHRGTRLVSSECGPLKNACVTCPYHAWTYNADGELIGAPNMKEVDSFDPRQFGLKPVACFDWCGFVMVNPGEAKANFEFDFAEIIERMKPWNLAQLELKKTLAYEVNANWKLVFQNYSECYHCPTVHPNLNRLTPYRGASTDLEEGAFLGGPMQLSEETETISTDGRRIGNMLPGLNHEQQRLVYYYTLFPTMFLSPHPDYVMAHELHRVDRSTTRVLCHFLSDSEPTDANMERAIQQWDDVNRQDWEVCELTQRGVRSPSYTPGPYSNLEPMLLAFDQHYRKVMEGQK